LRCTTNGAAGDGQGNTIKYLRAAANIGLGQTIKYLRDATGIGLGTTIKYLRRTTSASREQQPGHQDQIPRAPKRGHGQQLERPTYTKAGYEFR
jgi:hypothetical protein